MNKRFCKPLKLPRRIDVRVALLFAALLSAPTAQAGIPDWMRTLAGQSLPVYPEGTNAVVLLDEQLTTIDQQGEIKSLYRRACKILRPEGRDYATLVVYFDAETRLTYLKAWSISSQGKEYEVKEKDAIETSPFEGELYSDTHLKVLKIPAAESGGIVGYEYEQRQRPSVLQSTWRFQDHVPIRRARFTLRLPSGWEYRAHAINHSPVEPRTTSANQWIWEFENVPPIKEEPSMPAWRGLAGRLTVSYFPPEPVLRKKSFASWHDVGQWYAELSVSSRQSMPQIRDQVVALTSGKTMELDKLRALAAFVQREIRYVAVEIGVGGYQPHTAASVLVNRYGDCKDKATLLATMLGEIGVNSYYVLTNVDRGVVAPDFPSMLNFNHAILAIRLPRDARAAPFHALLDHHRLGPLLFFDPTDNVTPLGYLPSTEQGNRGLMITDDGGELIDLPLLHPEVNHLLRSARLTLDSAGTLFGEVKEVRSGSASASYRSALMRASPSEREKIFESFLAGFLNGFKLTDTRVENLDDLDKDLVTQYKFRSEQYAKKAGKLLVFRPRVFGHKGFDLFEAEPRTQAIEFSDLTMDTDEFEVTLPPGYKPDGLPAGLHTEFPFAEYQSQVEYRGNQVRYSRTYVVKDVMVPVERLPDLKKFFQQISSDERQMVVLKPAEN